MTYDVGRGHLAELLQTVRRLRHGGEHLAVGAAFAQGACLAAGVGQWSQVHERMAQRAAQHRAGVGRQRQQAVRAHGQAQPHGGQGRQGRQGRAWRRFGKARGQQHSGMKMLLREEQIQGV